MQERQKEEFSRLSAQGRNLGKLFLLNRPASYEWLNAMTVAAGASHCTIPSLTPQEQSAIERLLREREAFQPWTNRLVETISRLPFVKNRFRYHEYVQRVGRLEADGWLVRVYVNHERGED